ncbi:hypothetical protein HYC85_010450 [Camellia sinensis]|uniref:Uncharacterized protein n=1 Tax=Camellia sinensis TaxID=4442 RepID=A0A7J7HKN8_CAMSI|nr:hypothetical protein HYC85_010450 [Camellia sinensis]
MKNKAKCPLKLHTFKFIFNLFIIIHTRSHQQNKQGDFCSKIKIQKHQKQKTRIKVEPINMTYIPSFGATCRNY